MAPPSPPFLLHVPFFSAVAILFPADPHMLASLHFLDIPVAQAVHVHVHGVF